MTVAITYEQLVGQTFRDNAIRSVMMIDDQFIPYPNLIDLISNKEEINEQLIITSKRAAHLENFFQNKKILCDIDNSSSNIDIERIRKSDLLIIDYHLERDSPNKTLEILCGLKNSKHFNLAVVYTSNNLDQVWLEIATSFIETKNVNAQIEKIEDLDDFWSETILPSINAHTEYSLNRAELIEYLRTGKTKGAIKALLSRTEFKKDKEQICKIICDYHVSKSQIIHSENNLELKVFGDIHGNRWIKSGNIFVCLYQKSTGNIEEDPNRIWETLQNSLVDWKPSYYQLIQSEIQNHIESDSMAFNSIHDNDKHGQAAWLQEILKSKNPSESLQLIKSIYSDVSEELSFKFNTNEELKAFIESTFYFYKNKFSNEPDTNPAKFCSDVMELPFDINKTPKDMYHALNMHMSSKNYQNEHISTGTIFKTISKHNNSDNPGTWYLCVSAACDMIPSQANDPYNDRLTPHRLIRVLQLFPTNQDTAIKFATHSKYVYAYDNGERKYFSILNEESNVPWIDYMVIKNHADELNRSEIPLIIFTKDSRGDIAMTEISVKPKSQLRVGYAERYQSIAAQHGARIGVDYINSDIAVTDKLKLF
ncbi:response regulator receiver domain [Acinetobacter tibetensis]|uniref:response regulator receiver domain n=1 Tax=Acinetobacter tibetensis TaxID=2943497 RepID=UPI003A4E2928